MRLKSARIQNYRSIKDTGLFQVENLKTIFVGPNESGKTVILQALQQLNQPSDVSEFDELRDYPRSLYNDITTKKVTPENVEVVRGNFELEDEDKKLLPPEYRECTYVKYKMLNNKRYHTIENAPKEITYGDIKSDLNRLCAHISKQFTDSSTSSTEKDPTLTLQVSVGTWHDSSVINSERVTLLKGWLEKNYSYIDEDNQKEEERYNKLINQVAFNGKRDEVLKILAQRAPVFVLFNNYFKVKPLIHLEHLANRIDSNILDNDKYYDYGNTCLLKLLGFSARELSNIGSTVSPPQNNPEALKAYRDKLDRRSYQLDAASVRLTNEIKRIWNPDPKRPEADKLVISADGQYLKVVVEDNIGVKIELDQRSEGFQWLVSFYVVFFAEAMDKHKNAILLLDEPGMSLHGLKQREFRETISRLAENNQTIYTTHSPFLVGSNELDLVRVVELKDREEGTKVHTTISSSDPAGLLPLQEALGYDLAQSLFTQQRNLVLEGITDYWYLESTAQLLREAAIKDANLDEKTALIFANSAGKVVYYATILHAQKMKVAALLDSDAAGDQAAQQEHLVHALGNKNILRTKDFCSNVLKPEIEDLLRETLIAIVNDDFGVDVKSISDTNPTRPIVDIFTKEVSGFSKYKLAKSFVRWTRNNDASALNSDEVVAWTKLIQTINKVLK